MLVLTRREDQEIAFPNLNIRVQVLQVKGRAVKIGIDAPREISIVRPETGIDPDALPRVPAEAGDSEKHQLRNRLNTIRLGLALFEKQAAAGLHDASLSTAQRVVNELQKLDSEVASQPDDATAKQGRATRLLVVEDDDNERELLAGLLRLHGLDVDVAEGGEAALRKLRSNAEPDYVLMDMMMPNGSGPEAIREIRNDDRLRNLSLFAVSGTDPFELGIHEGEIDGWFPKPLDPQGLIDAIIRRSETTAAPGRTITA